MHFFKSYVQSYSLITTSELREKIKDKKAHVYNLATHVSRSILFKIDLSPIHAKA